MVAILAICPIRLRNFAELEIDQSIRRIGDNWWIVLSPDDTKTGQPDERQLPKSLTSAIDRWVHHWRSYFLNPGNAFWCSIKGGRLAYTYVGTLVTETTRRELGVAVNPHLFRDCAVYTVATKAGDRMGLAVALLQHRDERTTEIYNKGATYLAVERYQRILDDLAAR
jgi:site-specific recombinase XerC